MTLKRINGNCKMKIAKFKIEAKNIFH